MFKIAVKPYLNTNLKPHVVNGRNYYPVYLLVRAKGRNTKVRSHYYQEIYTEKEFAKLKIAESSDEIATVQSLVRAQVVIDGESFDTVLFGLLYSTLTLHPLKMVIANNVMLELYYLCIGKEKLGLSFYDWFHPKNQGRMASVLAKKGIKPGLVINKINAAFLYSFFGVLKDLVKDNPNRYQAILTRYSPVLEQYKTLAKQQLSVLE